ncbi:hypothetical protein BJF77_12035 [Kocuria sp. CNJ-770]|uniref:hypothetical protein n=1 Tax=Kocuria sp. CNJ-770 TaxID=1904964 RepID=UPI000968EFEE|nr:hypothetical protein [Kocuria sp. CNJ-770]OLT08688.1 hypothetical protein BJF77_12035 [Kocuria sp. CNJ-770]
MNRTCEHCGEPINLRRAHARTCSPRCRKALSRQKSAQQQIPACLRSVDRWVGWEYRGRRGKPSKVPVDATGRSLDVTDTAGWNSFTAARATHGEQVGFVLTGGDDISCIDLDDVLDEHGTPAAEVGELIAATSGVFYVEVSPSGRGLHVWHRGPAGPGSRRVENGLHVERYSRGRYITVTGNRFDGRKNG